MVNAKRAAGGAPVGGERVPGGQRAARDNLAGLVVDRDPRPLLNIAVAAAPLADAVRRSDGRDISAIQSKRPVGAGRYLGRLT